MRKASLLHPFLFALLPPLFLFARNLEEVSYSEFLSACAALLGLALVLVLLVSLALRDRAKAGIIVSAFFLVFFSYGQVYDLLEGRRLGVLEVGRPAFLLLAFGLALAAAVWLTVRSRRPLGGLVGTLNVIAASATLISLGSIGLQEWEAGRQVWRPSSDQRAGALAATAGALAPLRDIYYIILDTYASESVLKEVFHHDNRDFLDYLRSKGFRVSPTSTSNSCFTYPSLASSLNLKYINYLARAAGTEPSDIRILQQMVANNEVVRFLKARGYRYVHFCSGYSLTDGSPQADVLMRPASLREFTILLIRTSMLGPFFRGRYGLDLRRITLWTFARLAEMPRVRGPKFVFAHLLVPHPPFIFGPNGEPIPPSELGLGWAKAWRGKVKSDEYRRRYRDQLIFVNKKVREVVESLLSRSRVAPIIVLQGDHGPPTTFSRYLKPGEWGDSFFTRPSDQVVRQMIRERIGILNAYYLPGEPAERLYDSITPVNTFRLIFRDYFGAHYELLKDRNYVLTYKRPYGFTDVTGALKGKQLPSLPWQAPVSDY